MNIRELASQYTASILKYFLSSSRWLGLGAWLIFLFYINITLALMSLTSHQMLHKVSLIEVNGQAVSVTRIREFNNDLKGIEKWVEEAGDAYDETLEAYNKKSKELDAWVKKEIEEKFTGLLTEEQAEEKLAKVNEMTTKYNNFNRIEGCQLVEAQNQLNETIFTSVKKYNEKTVQYGFAASDFTKPAEKTIKAIPPQDDAETEDNTEADEETDPCPLIDFGPPDSYLLIDYKVKTILDDLEYFSTLQKSNETDAEATDSKPKRFGWLRLWEITDFSDMPIEMLTIMLVLAMGMLGGSIRLTRLYLKHEKNESLANYFFFPLLGAVTAFAVYILAKAGVLIISDSGSSGRGGSLSPYFISFIGLVSGMLADSALDTIQRVGGGWFKDSSSEKERWAVDLKEICKSKGISIIDIANLIECSPDTVQKWFDEINPVPPYPQKLIAARLNLPVRKLFSDIPPKTILTEPPVPEASIAEPT